MRINLPRFHTNEVKKKRSSQLPAQCMYWWASIIILYVPWWFKWVALDLRDSVSLLRISSSWWLKLLAHRLYRNDGVETFSVQTKSCSWFNWSELVITIALFVLFMLPQRLQLRLFVLIWLASQPFSFRLYSQRKRIFMRLILKNQTVSIWHVPMRLLEWCWFGCRWRRQTFYISIRIINRPLWNAIHTKKITTILIELNSVWCCCA